MKRFLLAALVALACRGSTEPSGPIAIEISSVARPTTGFAIHNRSGAAVSLKACDGQVGFPTRYTGDGKATVLVCLHATTTVTLAAGASQSGTVAIGAAGKYQVSVTLGDGSSYASAAFDVP
jgi:hypothetical protein